GTSFMEDYTYDLTPGQERILGAHMLEVCPSIAAGTPQLEIHPLGIGGRGGPARVVVYGAPRPPLGIGGGEDPVRRVFDAAPGPAVVVGMSDMGERFRLVANEIEVVPPSE